MVTAHEVDYWQDAGQGNAERGSQEVAQLGAVWLPARGNIETNQR